jgi:hypothetical protein
LIALVNKITDILCFGLCQIEINGYRMICTTSDTTQCWAELLGEVCKINHIELQSFALKQFLSFLKWRVFIHYLFKKSVNERKLKQQGNTQRLIWYVAIIFKLKDTVPLYLMNSNYMMSWLSHIYILGIKAHKFLPAEFIDGL